MSDGKPQGTTIHTEAGTFLVEGDHANVAHKIDNTRGGSVRLRRLVGTGFRSDWPRPGRAVHIRKDKIVAVEEW